jgi:hypothetical protein
VVLVGASAGQDARGSSIVADAVFAHDFEQVVGDSIVGVIGPDASKSSNLTISAVDLVRDNSAQHLQAPGGDYAAVDTGTRLVGTTSALSFSIFTNDRGSIGGPPENLVRLLSSYNGTGVPLGETLFDLLWSGGRRLRFYTEATSVLSTATVPVQDELWHQAGFVFDSGTVTFYFDGEQLGDSVAVPGVTEIATQNDNWTLVEDARPVSQLGEYFRGGSYDEAALWYRAVSAEEMRTLYEEGFSNASSGVIPEPSTIGLLAIGLVGVVLQARRRGLSQG